MLCSQDNKNAQQIFQEETFSKTLQVIVDKVGKDVGSKFKAILKFVEEQFPLQNQKQHKAFASLLLFATVKAVKDPHEILVNTQLADPQRLESVLYLKIGTPLVDCLVRMETTI